jgi:hypothetical protein
MSWNEDLKPLLDNYIRSLFKELEAEKIIIADTKNKDKPTYRLNGMEISGNNAVTTTTTTIPFSSENVIFRSLLDLRNIAKAVYQNLDYTDSKQSHSLSSSKILERLEENKAFNVRWKNKKDILGIFDSLDNLSNDPTIEKGIEKELTDNNFNPNVIIAELLEFFGRQKVIQHFGNYSSTSIIPSKYDSIDWIAIIHYNVGDLYFNFKLRRTSPVPDTESLFQAIKVLENSEYSSYAFLVVFTNENPGAFDKFKFQFKQILLNDLPEFTSFTDRIRFMPVSIGNMSLIDQEFGEFKRTYIEDDLSFVFKNQPTPRGFNDRNDHVLERTFDIRTTSFRIVIEPIKTDFWRLGFRFIQNETFPPIAQDRHENDDVSDIHICVGDLITSDFEDHQWEKSNQLTLTEYHAEVVLDDFKGITNYSGGKVGLIVESNEDASRVLMSVKVDDQFIGKKVYNLSRYRYCRLSAWRDYGEFELRTNIAITYNK